MKRDSVLSDRSAEQFSQLLKEPSVKEMLDKLIIKEFDHHLNMYGEDKIKNLLQENPQIHRVLNQHVQDIQQTHEVGKSRHYKVEVQNRFRMWWFSWTFLLSGFLLLFIIGKVVHLDEVDGPPRNFKLNW